MTTTKNLPVIMLACLGAIFIGFAPALVRLSDLGPIITGFYRMLFAMPFLYIWMRHEQRKKTPIKLSTKENLLILTAGAIFALDIAFWNWSVDYTFLVNAALFNNTAVFFVPLIMWVVFKTRPSTRFLFISLMAFLGCFLILGESVSLSLDNLKGDIMALISGVMVSIYVVSIKKIRERLETGTLMFWTGVFSVLSMGVISVFFQESFWPLTYKDFISVFGQAILVHLIGQGLLAYSMKSIPASYSALIMLLAPITATTLGILFYEETLGLYQGLGAFIILGSILLAKQKGHSRN